MTATKKPVVPAIQSKALTWFRYDVSAQEMSSKTLSYLSKGLDRDLTHEAWQAADGSCRVDVVRFNELCEWGQLQKEQRDRVARELVKSKRWRLTADGLQLECAWLLEAREDGAEAIEQRRVAGQQSAKKRAEKAEARRAAQQARRAARAEKERALNDRSRSASPSPDEAFFGSDSDPLSALQYNDLNDRSTTDEHKTRQTTTDLLSEDQVVVPSDAAACHAEGAAATPAGPPVPRRVPNLRVLMVEEQLRDTVVTPGWMDAPTAALVQQLGARGTLLRVDVERALGRLYAPLCSDRTPLGHAGLRDEIGALLRGEAGRDGYLPTEHAYEAVICALFGALTHRTPRISPLLFRAIATETAKAMVAQPEADGRELAAEITDAFDRGVRKASGYTLAHECTTPSRLNGHPTRTEASAG
jgi:hypothetical protein